MQGLDALGPDDGGREAARDILGHMLAAHGHGLDVHQTAAPEHRRRGRAAAHVDTDGPQVHLVLFQRRQRGHKGCRDHAVQLQVGPLDAGPQGVEHGLGHRDHQQLDAQGLSEHGAGVAHAALPVDRPAHGQDVNGASTRQLDLGQSIADRADQIVVRDGPGTDGDAAGDAGGGQRSAGRRYGHALDIDAGQVLGALHGLGDGSGGLIEIDDGAAADAA